MRLTDRDRRALLILGVFLIVLLIFVWANGNSDTATPVEAAGGSIEAAEQRLERMRQLAAQVPGREEVLKQVTSQLAQREKRILVADTAAQAQAQLLQVVRRVARAQTPAIEIRASEFGTVKSFGKDYGEVPVSITMECGIEQLLNVLTELTAQEELSAVQDLRIYAANAKEKTTNVRLTVTAVVPKRLVPAKGSTL